MTRPARLHVIYRLSQSSTDTRPRPSFFSKRLSLPCSLLTAAENHGACDLTVVQDGLVDQSILAVLPPTATVLKAIGLGNSPSYMAAIALASSGDAALAYMSEDDYLYLPDALIKLCECLNTRRADYVTLYDHPARYRVPSDDVLLPSRPFCTQSHHWQFVESSCLSFGAHSETIRADAERIRALIGTGPYPQDRVMWRGLQQLQPSRISGPGRTLAGPVPSLACHADLRDGLAPVINWEHWAERLEAEWS